MENREKLEIIHDIIELAKKLKEAPETLKPIEDAFLTLNPGPHDILDFVLNVKNCNVERFQNIIIERIESDIWASVAAKFAARVEGADLEKLENAVIKTNNPEMIGYFAITVPNCNMEKLENAIIKTEQIYWINQFANYVPNCNKDKLKNAIIKLNDGGRF